ncbi:hypothetical protein BBP40_010639 [Aspergillus hancockii]|nr:hypothetical protein BBP40_010639 [Aspergillus hancockii]
MVSTPTPIFCRSQITPYRPQALEHERKFDGFLIWARVVVTSEVSFSNDNASSAVPEYAVRMISDVAFTKVTGQWLIEMNFKKVNSFKNFKCTRHNKFFELNLYQKDPANKYH